mgnify:CR=1 FL=1
MDTLAVIRITPGKYNRELGGKIFFGEPYSGYAASMLSKIPPSSPPSDPDMSVDISAAESLLSLPCRLKPFLLLRRTDALRSSVGAFTI